MCDSRRIFLCTRAVQCDVGAQYVTYSTFQNDQKSEPVCWYLYHTACHVMGLFMFPHWEVEEP